MAHSDKNIVITPNISSTSADPKIVFSGADASTGPQNITLQVYPTNSGTLSFEGSAGQLFSITNSMTGTIYSVNDVSGIPSIEVLDTGLVKLGQYSGNILLGTGTDNVTDKLQVTGSISATSSIKGTTLTSTVGTGTAPLIVSSSTMVSNLNAQYWNGNSFSSYLNQGVRTSDNPTFGTVYAALSGTASNATTAGGLAVHTGTNNEVNKIVRTDGNGYIQAGWINTTSGDNGAAAIDRVYASNDGYIRYYTPANFRTVLDVPTRGGSGATGTWSITASSLSNFLVSNQSNNGIAVAQNYIGYITDYSGTQLTSGVADGALYSQYYSSSWQHEIYGDYRSGQIALRGKNNGTWQSWRTVIDTSNASSYVATVGKMLAICR